MMRLIPFVPFVLIAVASLGVEAGQVRSISDRVYSDAQASRGQGVGKAQCAECHGNAMEGVSGPPLVGDDFLANWSARPLTNLVDKIQKTMPFTSSGGSLPPPEGNLAELMRAIAFPNENIIFNTQLKDPGAQAKKELAKSPFDYVEWGATVYPGWLAIDQAAVALAGSAPLLLTPGRKCQNGRPVPVDRADWKQYVAALVEVGKLAHQLSQKRDYDAFLDISEKLNDACANCHKGYRDKGGAEGSGTTRCQPPSDGK